MNSTQRGWLRPANYHTHLDHPHSYYSISNEQYSSWVSSAKLSYDHHLDPIGTARSYNCGIAVECLSHEIGNSYLHFNLKLPATSCFLEIGH